MSEPGELWELDAVAGAALVRSGDVSPVDLVDAVLARIEAVDGALNAFTVVLADQARREAREAETAAREGDRRALLGVPVTVKDHIWLRGAPATNGSLALAGFVPDEDCVAVARLRAAGAVVVGKTNNPEFCYRSFTDNDLFGLTRNPWDLGRTPGGSSGGAGAAVAAGMAPVGLGTDGGGSVRIPASFCGVLGLKPTFGLVPKEPGFKGWKTLSVNGPLTRTVRDAALVLSVVAGVSAADDMTWAPPDGSYVDAVERADVAGLRVAFSADLGFADVDPDVRAAFHAAVEVLGGLGCELVEDHPRTPPPAGLWNRLALTEGYASEGPLLAEWEAAMTPGIAAIVRAGRDLAGWEYVDALHERAAFTRVWAEFFERYDLLVTPGMPGGAFPVGQLVPESIDGVPVDPFFDDWCGLALPANLTGMPAAAVPAGFGAAGLPVAMQVVGPRFADARVLALAAAYERAAPWAGHWPAPSPP